MNTNWYKIALFCLVSFLLGWAVSHFCCRGGCHRGGSECHGQSMCEHGGGCCSEGGGHCDKEGCDHKMGGACCKGDGHGHGCKGDCQGRCDGSCKGACGGGGHACCKGGNAEDKIHVIIDGLKEKNFQGDTTISIEGGTVNVTRTGDKMEVKVEMKDSLKVEEKTMEVHAH